jgi:glycosyltransferase involved in cell wall biosynthesis
MTTLDRKLNLLHIILSAGETNCQYHEHCLPVRHQRNISICTYFHKTDPTPKEITLFNGDNSLLGFFRAMKAALQAQKSDIIHVHSPITGCLFLLGTLLSGWYFKVKPHAVYTVHNSYLNYKLRNRLLMLPVFVGFQELIFCSHACLDSFPSYFRRLGGSKIHVVQNAVNIDRIDWAISQISPKRKSDLFTVVSIGRLIPIKNPFTLLKAFQQSNPEKSQLVFVGEGDLRARLTQEVEQCSLQEHVKMTGLVSRDEVFQYAAQADVFVSTSRGEGLPVAVLEVMASGCPVILSDIPPHREITKNVDFIPLIAPDDIEGFSREIRRFQKISKERRRELGQQCRQIIEDKFSLASMHRGYEKVYAQVLEDEQNAWITTNIT